MIGMPAIQNRPRPLAEATKHSTTVWQRDLHSLFQQAKERFPDILWRLMDEVSGGSEEMWGHKGMHKIIKHIYIPKSRP